MTLTTPHKPVDLSRIFPELEELQRTTVRLHPRRGEPTVTSSSIGGPLLWPIDEPWPHCEAPQHGDPSVLWGRVAMVPILQIYALDVPDLPFPPDTDLCQVLWCPVNHPPEYMPAIRVFWRNSALINEVLTDIPEPVESDDDYLPVPCVLTPERVQEFPGVLDLPGDLRERIGAWDDDRSANPEGWLYHYHLSTAPGTKVGGWVDWMQDPVWFECERGHPVQHFLTIASWEHDGESCKTWTPVEEQHRLTGYQVPEMIEPTGIMIGDAGSMYLFICMECPERPIEGTHQGS